MKKVEGEGGRPALEGRKKRLNEGRKEVEER
jgi:hypothetical protein